MTRTPISIAFSSDSSGLPRNATVIASLLRRTGRDVSVRFYCRSFSEHAISHGRLLVEFLPAGEAQQGNFPQHVGPAVFDRLRVIPDAVAWDRCLIMNHDQLVLCDLAPYCDEDFEGNLLMGRLFGPGNTLGLQMALTVATEGKVKGVGRKWNLVPQWDNLADGPSGPERSLYGTAGEPAKWVNGLPEGIIHWTRPQKPWHGGTSVWRPDLWESEETSWEALRRGWWVKPEAVLIGPPDVHEAMALARRGWKVQVISDPRAGLKANALPFPDVHWHSPAQARRRRPDWLHGAEMVRFGPGIDALPWLAAADPLPSCIVLQGPVKRAAITAIRRLGYGRMARHTRHGWPAGGPAPSVLDYAPCDGAAFNLPEEEDLYLQFTSRRTPRAELGAPGK